MDDRALLENAARAAGIELRRWNQMYAGYETAGGIWNPLLNDGDTLRLAMALMMTIVTGPCKAFAQAVWLTLAGVFIEEDTIYQATDVAVRRAVVRAAAAIWEARS